MGQTDRQTETDSRPLYKSCFAYSAGSAKKIRYTQRFGNTQYTFK